MNKFNIESARLLSIIFVICFIFIMVIWKAFDFLPQNETSNNTKIQTIIPKDNRIPSASNEDEILENNINNEEVLQDEDNSQEDEFSADYSEGNDAQPMRELEEGEALSKITENSDQNVQDLLNSAKTKKQEGNFSESIFEYKKVITLTNDTEIKALCYEELAIIDAKQQNYDSALISAQTAYNTSPNTNREVLIARLYYKKGDVNRASARMNSILKKEF